MMCECGAVLSTWSRKCVECGIFGALAELDGSTDSAVRLLTGLDPKEYGGLPDEFEEE